MRKQITKIYPVKLFTKLNLSYSAWRFYFTRIFFILTAFLMASFSAQAAVIFQDDYDGSGDLGWTCADGVRTGYTGQAACDSSTYNTVTHHCGEINTGGHSGNALTLWRRNGIWGNNDWTTPAYCGYLDRYLTSSEFNNHYKEVYVRWYVNFPPEWDANLGDANNFKLNRLHYGTSADDTSNEMYLNFHGATFKNGKIMLYPTGGLGWVWDSQNTISELGINDGNWHSIELRFKIGTTDGGFQVWVDGDVVTICDGSGENCATNHANINTGSANDYITTILPPGVGNITDGTWTFPTDGWYAAKFDDYVVSTTYIGPESSDTTAPASPSGLAVI